MAGRVGGRVGVLLMEFGLVEVIHAFGNRGCEGGFARARHARDAAGRTRRPVRAILDPVSPSVRAKFASSQGGSFRLKNVRPSLSEPSLPTIRFFDIPLPQSLLSTHTHYLAHLARFFIRTK